MIRIASLLLLAGACGQVHALADAGDHDTGGGSDGADARIDAPPATTKVSATVLGPTGVRAPSTGVAVVFSKPDGSVAARETSGVDGKVSADLPDGGSVTAVWPLGASFQIETIAGVKPGDDLILIGDGTDGTAAGSMTVTWAPRAGTGMYFVYTSCGETFAEGTATSAVASMTAYCRRDTMTVAVAAFDGSGLIGYQEQRGVAFHDGGRVDLGNAWIDQRQVDVAISGLSPTVESGVSFDRFNTDVFGFDGGASGNVTAATASLAIGAPTTGGAAMARTTVVKANTTAESVQVFLQPIDGGALTYGFDVGAHLLPWIDLPVLDPATATITVPQTGSGAPDFASAEVGYRHAGAIVNWLVIAPDLAHPIALPQLPAQLGDLGPAAGDAVLDSAAAAFLVESDAIDGYDAVRADTLAARLAIATGRSSATLARVSIAFPGS